MTKDGQQMNYNNDEINKIVVIFLFEKREPIELFQTPQKLA